MKYLANIVLLLIHMTGLAQSHNEFMEAFKKFSANQMYPEADSVVRSGLNQFPNDHDLLCNQARLSAWQGHYDKANEQSDRILTLYPQDQEAYQLKAHIAYWSGQNEKLLTLSQEYLTIDPKDDDFRYYEAYAYHQLGMVDKSSELIGVLLTKNPTHESALKLQQNIKNSHYNFADVEITYATFSEVLDPWKQIRLGYGQNKKLPWNTHIMGVERFATKGWMIQSEAYPSLGQKSYMFIEASYSPNSFMSNYTAGLEVFQGIYDFELSAGTKRFKFSHDEFFLHKASLGLYKKSFFAHYQIMYSQARDVNNYTHILRLRSYLGSNHFVEGEIVSGINAQEYITPEGTIDLMTHRSAGLKYAVNLSDQHSIQIRTRLRNEEYRSELFRTRVDFQIGYKLKMY